MDKWRIVDPTGVARGLQSYYHFYITSYSGMDSPPVEIFGTPYATLPGEAADGERVLARDLFLTGRIVASSEQLLHQYRATLLDHLKPWRQGQTGWNTDTVLLRYYGPERTIEIPVKFVGDYGGARQATDGCTQELVLHFRAQESPWWRGLTDVTTTLDNADATTMLGVAGRVGGKWNALGPPGVSGGTAIVFAMAHDDNYLYVAGNFVNLDNKPGLNYIARWDGAAWSAVGPAGAGTGVVNALLLLPDGRLVVGGAFTNWGGNANGDYCVIYDPVTNTYAPMATGPGVEVRDIALNPANGHVLISGWGNIIYYWNGAAWTALGAFAAAAVLFSLCFTPNGTLYAGGFADIPDYGGTVFGSLASDLITWTEYTGIEAGYVSSVRALADGRVVVGGSFTALDGTAAANVAVWNGQHFTPMGVGLNDVVERLFVNAGGEMYALGRFDGIYNPDGKTTSVSGAAVYHGGTWYRLDANFPAGTILRALAFDGEDLYLGGYLSGTVQHSGHTNLVLAGACAAGATFPVFTIRADPGADDPAILYFIENVLTGSRIWFNDLTISPGETVTIDCNTQKITSDYVTGGRTFPGQPRRGSDFAGFRLANGINTINLFCTRNPGSFVTASIIYRPQYDGIAAGEIP